MNPRTLKAETYTHLSVWIAAGIVGLIAVGYAKLIAFAQNIYFTSLQTHPIAATIATPLFFLFATALVVRLAPAAKGSGIPQVLEAIDASRAQSNVWQSPLVSLRTAGIKVLSSTAGVLGGASIGREGPTVQLASSGFAFIGRYLDRRSIKVDPQSFLIAGAASGVAAAFNTPIAGIAFAIEEIADGAFGSFKQIVMLSVIIAGICAQGILGNYLYFGHPTFEEPTLSVFPQALLLGAIAGIAGGLFAKALAFPALSRLPVHWVKRTLVCGAICSALALVTQGDSAGSGYEATRKALENSNIEGMPLLFPVTKLITTVLSYLSGMAGGIFSPSLSIGAGIGLTAAKIFHFHNFKACALMGMVAFFSGAIQAPLTGTIIVMEMTDQHLLILPFMVAALIGHAAGKLFMPVPLYRYLANAAQKSVTHT